MEIALGELARRYDLELQGDPDLLINGVCTLRNGRHGALSFLANPLYARYLETTAASAVVLAPTYAHRCRAAVLISEDPYLAYARIAALFAEEARPAPGIHPRAWVSEDAFVDSGAAVAAGAVVEAGAHVAAGVLVGPGSVIGEGCVIGADCRLGANVSICDGVRLGERVRVLPGAVIGSRGFGLARDGAGWLEVPQLGGVVIGDDVEVGANTTIDRGALEDTVIEDGVKLDNQIQVGHNVRIGAHTAIAGCTGIAGSVTIGRRCMIGGHVGINGHIRIDDDVAVMGMTMVTKSLRGPGVYASGLPVEPASTWRQLVARVRRLHKLENKIKSIAQKIEDKEEKT